MKGKMQDERSVIISSTPCAGITLIRYSGMISATYRHPGTTEIGFEIRKEISKWL
jgi:hypothetical protein